MRFKHSHQQLKENYFNNDHDTYMKQYIRTEQIESEINDDLTYQYK